MLGGVVSEAGLGFALQGCPFLFLVTVPLTVLALLAPVKVAGSGDSSRCLRGGLGEGKGRGGSEGAGGGVSGGRPSDPESGWGRLIGGSNVT